MFTRARRAIQRVLMAPAKLVAALLQQATAQGSRSTVLRPLGWLVGICAPGLLVAVELSAPTWVIVTFAVFMGLTIVLYLGSYTYCLFTDKEALRSERYSIQKLAIEKGIVGDSHAGVFPSEPEETTIGMLGPAKEGG